MVNQNILIIIPARSGSKGLPKKNTRLLKGRPLFEYILYTAQKFREELLKDRVGFGISSVDIVFSTDDKFIIEYLENSSTNYIITRNRPQRLAEDSVTLDDVCVDALYYVGRIRRKEYTTNM